MIGKHRCVTNKNAAGVLKILTDWSYDAIDANLIAHLRSVRVKPFIKNLGADFYSDEQAILSAINHQGCFNVIHLESMMKVDVFIAKDRTFDRHQLKRVVRKSIRLIPTNLSRLQAPRMSSSPNRSGIEWERKFLKDNGSMFWGFSKWCLRIWTIPTSQNGASNSVSLTYLKKLSTTPSNLNGFLTLYFRIEG